MPRSEGAEGQNGSWGDAFLATAGTHLGRVLDRSIGSKRVVGLRLLESYSRGLRPPAAGPLWQPIGEGLEACRGVQAAKHYFLGVPISC